MIFLFLLINSDSELQEKKSHARLLPPPAQTNYYWSHLRTAIKNNQAGEKLKIK